MIRKDSELLRLYALQRSEESFAALVERYLDMVWAAARRITKNDELARDVSQSVFVDLAAKAGRLKPDANLSGWLYRAASFAACKAVRSEARRADRERKAMEFHMQHTEPDSDSGQTEALSLLDDAIAGLPEKDRTAIVMRFLAGKSHSEIGDAMGSSSDAAQKRVSRALEALRQVFHRNGIAVSVASVTSTLLSASAQAAPPGLAAVVVSSSLTAAGTGVGFSAALIHLKTHLIAMKPKIIIAAIAASTVGTPLIVQQSTLKDIEADYSLSLRKTEALPALRAEHTNLKAAWLAAEEFKRLEKDHSELEALREELGKLNGMDLDTLRQLESSLKAALADLEESEAYSDEIQEEVDSRKLRVHTVNAMKKLGLAARIWATDNNDRLPSSFVVMSNEFGKGFTYEAESKKLKGEFDGELTLDRFEWMPQPRTVSEMEPQLALFREKDPRQLPDGTWERCYTLCDGSVQTLVSETSNFTELDAKFTASESNIPEQFVDHPAYLQNAPDSGQ